MAFWKKIFNRIFKKQVVTEPETNGQATKRFEISLVTPGQVAAALESLTKAMNAHTKQKKINYNPKLQHRKKKSQNKNWAKWRV